MDVVNTENRGIVRAAARVIPIRLAQPRQNAQAVIADAQLLSDQGVDLVAYPELCLTGSTCGDLFFHQALIEAADEAVGLILEASRNLRPVIVVGAPVHYESQLFNCAVVIHDGRILGVVPKWLANPETISAESRWFCFDGSSGLVSLGGCVAVMDPGRSWRAGEGPGTRFRVVVGTEYFELLATEGDPVSEEASLIVSIASAPASVGGAARRKQGAALASLSSEVALLATHCGVGESSTNASWDSQTFAYDRGQLLDESELFAAGPSGIIVDLTGGLKESRYTRETPEVGDTPLTQGRVSTHHRFLDSSSLSPRYPFVPSDPSELEQVCEEAFRIQVCALAQRMKAIGTPNLVIGVSGGLDSTLALLVCAAATDHVDRPRSDILAFTMPGFATSKQTKASALALMEAMGTTFETIDIRSTATEMLTNIGHEVAAGEELYDVTFENVQAGLRTDYLFRLANQRGGIVVGTGDLSELALGWCTYGVGDHMSHYSVNCGVPKTLIPHLIRWVATQWSFDAKTTEVLNTIITQEISPELVPSKDPEGLQSTEATIGPYSLNDFFLYHFLRGEKPSDIASAALTAWADPHRGSWPPDTQETERSSYDLPTISHWLEKFLWRFFSSQFKRSCVPDGPQVFAGVSLSPRGGWVMPSDVSAETWVRELNDNLSKDE
jgi:NAD+ synthase (glutamine-hydrolysing)